MMTWMLQQGRSAWEIFLEVERIQLTWDANDKSKLEPLKTFTVAATCRGATLKDSQRTIVLESPGHQSAQFRKVIQPG